MENINEAVRNFLDDQVRYYSPQHAEFITFEDNTVFVSTNWPDLKYDENFYVNLFFESKTIEEFVDVFGIKSVNDLNNITSDSLLQLFHMGKADVCCAIDNHETSYELRFRKKNNKMMVTDEKGVVHEIPEILQTAQQFKDYIHQHWMLNRILKYD